VGKKPEEPSVEHDGKHGLAVESVAKSEDHPLEENGDCTIPSPRAELLSEISAEDEFFTKSAAGRGEH
jgi:hypothetical protein